MVNYDSWILDNLRLEAKKRLLKISVKDGVKTLASRLRQDDKRREMSGKDDTQIDEEEYYGSPTAGHVLTFEERRELHKMEMEKLQMQREMEMERERAVLERLAMERELKREERESTERNSQTKPVVKVSKTPMLKIREMRENEEIDDYFRIFEFSARAQSLPVEDWLASLVPKLTEKAKSIYLEMSENDAELDYYAAKKAILKSYQLTADHYRHRFRTSEKQVGEDFVQWAKRTRRYLDRWMTIAEAMDRGAVLEHITMEKLLDSVGSELRTWLKERNPKTAEELADLANAHVQARKDH